METYFNFSKEGQVPTLKIINEPSKLSQHPTQSHFISKLGLSLLRLLSSILILITLIINFILPQDPLSYILHLNYLNYYGLALYIWTVTYLSFFSKPNPLNSSSGIFKCLQLQFAICVIINLVVTIGYFTVLINRHTLSQLSSLEYFIIISMNGLNSLIIYLELSFSQFTIPIIALPISLGIIISYFIYCHAIHTCFNIWVYSFLNFQQNMPLYINIIMGTIMLTIISFGISYIFINLRDRLIHYLYPPTPTKPYSSKLLWDTTTTTMTSIV